jgi:hypothetical protein
MNAAKENLKKYYFVAIKVKNVAFLLAQFQKEPELGEVRKYKENIIKRSKFCFLSQKFSIKNMHHAEAERNEYKNFQANNW